jgi:hypothetical protein
MLKSSLKQQCKIKEIQTHNKNPLLKGTIARDFRSSVFFHQSTPPRALIHGQKPFCIWPNIRRNNRQNSNFSGVIDPAETISAQSLAPLKLPEFFLLNFFLQNYEIVKQFKNFMENFSGVIDPAETISTYKKKLFLKKWVKGTASQEVIEMIPWSSSLDLN